MRGLEQIELWAIEILEYSLEGRFDTIDVCILNECLVKP